MELSDWFEQRGSADVTYNMRGALDTIGRNEEVHQDAIAALNFP